MSELLFWAVGIFLGITWSYTNITETDFAKGQEVCKVNGGLSVYVSETIGNPHVECKNGAKFKLREGEK